MDHTRHMNIFDASRLSVTLIGAGGIGAITALTLAKMGIAHLTVYDGDTISPENMSTQLHRVGTEDEPKVEALQKTLGLFSDDTLVYPNYGRINRDDELHGQIVISAVDSIQARKDIWAAVKAGKVGWYIDARMSAEEFQMHVVDMSLSAKVAKYDEMILDEDDSKVPDVACTEKATFYCAAIAAGQLGSAVRKILTGIRPADYLIHNILNDKLFHLGDA